MLKANSVFQMVFINRHFAVGYQWFDLTVLPYLILWLTNYFFLISYRTILTMKIQYTIHVVRR